MAKEQKSAGEVKGVAEMTADQVRSAVDTYFEYLKRTVAAAPSGGTAFGDTLKGYAEKNISMTHEFVRRLSHAKDLQEMLSIQTEYMQALANAFGEQTKALTDSYAKTTSDALKNSPLGMS